MRNTIEINRSANKNASLKKGQIYRHIEENEYYILAQVVTDYVLVCLNDGNCWTQPQERMGDVFGPSRERFERIDIPITLTPNKEE